MKKLENPTKLICLTNNNRKNIYIYLMINGVSQRDLMIKVIKKENVLIKILIVLFIFNLRVNVYQVGCRIRKNNIISREN